MLDLDSASPRSTDASRDHLCAHHTGSSTLAKWGWPGARCAWRSPRWPGPPPPRAAGRRAWRCAPPLVIVRSGGTVWSAAGRPATMRPSLTPGLEAEGGARLVPSGRRSAGPECRHFYNHRKSAFS